MRRQGIFLALCCACGSNQAETPGPSGEATSVSARDEAPAPVLAVPETKSAPAPAAPTRRTSRNLIAEAGRAELRSGGLFIDVGTLDQHKYSRGGWMNGWGRNALDGAETIAHITGKRAFLDIVLDVPASEIVVRAKGRGSLGVALDKGGAKRSALGREYALHRFSLGKMLTAGRHRIQFSGKGISVDWVWIAETSGAEPTAQPRIKQGALWQPDAGSYSFHLIPEQGTRLDVETRGQAQIKVVAERDGHEALVLLDEQAGQGHKIDLAAIAGAPVRLRLISNAPVSWTKAELTQVAPPKAQLSARPKNVILLLIDTQRADSFSVVGKGIGANAYEGLIAKSTTFKNAYNNENWTKPSIATIDTGLYPDSHLARWRKDRCSKDLVFLSEHLKEQGFATAAMVSNISAGPKFGFNQGWDVFTKTDNAQHAFARAKAWLAKRDADKPFFLYVQTIDPHVPFSVPEGSAEKLYGGPYKGKLGPTFEQSEEDALNAGTLKLGADDARWLRALYDAEVLYHDEHLGTFLKDLEAAETLRDTAFIVLNDHGEEFGEHGRWGHGWTVGDVLYRSPLLMHLPGYFPAKTFDEVVEHLDIAPTIVDALGLPAMANAQGGSLLPLVHDEERSGRAPYSALLYGRPKQRAIRVGDFKMLLQADRTQRLFDMEREPEQKTDVKAAHPIALRLCEVAMGEAIANPKRSERQLDQSSLPAIRAEIIDE
ncbi:MAG: sulfatase [Myxococcales bacterium]|nr:sulfatase [Myxococcales bacterium]